MQSKTGFPTIHGNDTNLRNALNRVSWQGKKKRKQNKTTPNKTEGLHADFTLE